LTNLGVCVALDKCKESKLFNRERIELDRDRSETETSAVRVYHAILSLCLETRAHART